MSAKKPARKFVEEKRVTVLQTAGQIITELDRALENSAQLRGSLFGEGESGPPDSPSSSHVEGRLQEILTKAKRLQRELKRAADNVKEEKVQQNFTKNAEEKNA